MTAEVLLLKAHVARLALILESLLDDGVKIPDELAILYLQLQLDGVLKKREAKSDS